MQTQPQRGAGTYLLKRKHVLAFSDLLLNLSS
jgi:hypothetical protein